MESKLTKAAILSVLDAAVAEDGPLETCKLVLLKVAPTPDRVVAPGDLTPCTFTGYTDRDIVWGSAYVGTDGKFKVSGAGHHYECTADPDPGQEVGGYAIMNGDKSVVHRVVRYGAGEEIALAKDVGFDVIPSLVWGD